MMMKIAVALVAVFGFVSGAVLVQTQPPAALQAMVDTEREFARTALVKGVRDSFLEFFSDDAVAFSPEPIPAKTRLRARPARPAAVQELKWEPRTGDVAASGELGWLTGPATFLDRSAAEPKPQYSNYLSIWRKEADGRWRVFIDCGISVPEPAVYQPGFTRFAFADRYRGAEGSTAAAGTLLDADRELNERIADEGAGRAYAPRLTERSRLNRQGFVPVVGASAIVEWLDAHTSHATARTGASHASQAGDLGYTYGTYEVAGSKPETAAYVRIWNRDARGRWFVAADVMQPKG